MIRAFDHGVIAVRDLDAAQRRYREGLGLDARPGGRHTGRGTANSIVRFGADYLELLAVPDPAAEIAATGERGRVLVDYLARREGGLVGYCLATDDAAALAAHLREAGLDVLGPAVVERVRPDGSVLRWQLVWPGGAQWRRPWPFFIQADTRDGAPLPVEPAGQHALGATGVVGVAVAVRDRVRGEELYRRQLGLPLVAEGPEPSLAAWRTAYQLGDFTIDVLSPTRPGPLADEIASVGEGPFALTLAVASEARALACLGEAGIAPRPVEWAPRGWLIPLECALGARLVLVTADGVDGDELTAEEEAGILAADQEIAAGQGISWGDGALRQLRARSTLGRSSSRHRR